MNSLTTSLDAFVVNFRLCISRHDLCSFDSSHNNPGAPYLSLPDMVHHIRGRQFHPEAVPDFHHNDALFLFAMRAHFDEVGGRTTQGPMNQALRRIIHMGIYDWEAKEKNQVASKSFFPVRYAAVLRNKLFNIVEHNGNQVSLVSVSRLLVVKTHAGFS